MFPPRPEDLQQPDGSVRVPARAVPALVRLLVRGVLAGRAARDYSVNFDWAVLGDAIAEGLESSARGTGSEGPRSLEESRGLLTVQDAADRSGRTTRGVRKACAEGRLRGVKVGDTWLITESEVERWRHREPLADS